MNLTDKRQKPHRSKKYINAFNIVLKPSALPFVNQPFSFRKKRCISQRLLESLAAELNFRGLADRPMITSRPISVFVNRFLPFGFPMRLDFISGLGETTSMWPPEWRRGQSQKLFCHQFYN